MQVEQASETSAIESQLLSSARDASDVDATQDALLHAALAASAAEAGVGCAGGAGEAGPSTAMRATRSWLQYHTQRQQYRSLGAVSGSSPAALARTPAHGSTTANCSSLSDGSSSSHADASGVLCEGVGNSCSTPSRPSTGARSRLGTPSSRTSAIASVSPASSSAAAVVAAAERMSTSRGRALAMLSAQASIDAMFQREFGSEHRNVLGRIDGGTPLPLPSTSPPPPRATPRSDPGFISPPPSARSRTAVSIVTSTAAEAATTTAAAAAEAEADSNASPFEVPMTAPSLSPTFTPTSEAAGGDDGAEGGRASAGSRSGGSSSNGTSGGGGAAASAAVLRFLPSWIWNQAPPQTRYDSPNEVPMTTRYDSPLPAPPPVRVPPQEDEGDEGEDDLCVAEYPWPKNGSAKLKAKASAAAAAGDASAVDGEWGQVSPEESESRLREGLRELATAREHAMQGWAQAERTRVSLAAAAAAAEEDAREVAAASVRALVTALDEAEMQVHAARRECEHWRHLHEEVHVNAQAQASVYACEREAAGTALEALRARVEQARSEARAEALTMARAELDGSHVGELQSQRELQASVEALTARAAQAEAQAREAIERENVWHIVWGGRRGTSTAGLKRTSSSSARGGGARQPKALVTALVAEVMADEGAGADEVVEVGRAQEAAAEEANVGRAEQVVEDKGARGDDGQAREREEPLAALVAELASARIRAEEAVAEGERLRARLEAVEQRTEQERMKGEGELRRLQDELRRAGEQEVARHESRTSVLGWPRMASDGLGWPLSVSGCPHTGARDGASQEGTGRPRAGPRRGGRAAARKPRGNDRSPRGARDGARSSRCRARSREARGQPGARDG